MKIFELKPTQQKSFYGKAQVLINDEESAITLLSYGTPILTETAEGITRHWNGWSNTTGRHIKAFCNLNKKDFQALPYKEYKN